MRNTISMVKKITVNQSMIFKMLPKCSTTTLKVDKNTSMVLNIMTPIMM